MEASSVSDNNLTIDISNSIISEDNVIFIETTTEENTPENSNRKSILIDKEKYDKECSKWSTICFILGVIIVMIVGISII